jgi:CubicO group peptidase (beta-lactamase class C family)
MMPTRGEDMATKLVRCACVLLATIWLSATASAQGLTSPDPAGAGFSAERLARIAPWYQSQIDAGKLPGAVVAVARNGKLAYLQATGTYDRAGKIPLTPDAIFWIASMTKPVTSVAAMMLVEEGKLDLAAPVSKYLSELKDMQVGVEKTDSATSKSELVLEAPKRPMEVFDLLRHTSGLVYPEEGSSQVHRLYRQATFRRDKTLAEFVTSLAKLPLAYQPREVWEYSWSVDVLARVVEVASGQNFDEFLQTRIFKPLGMIDTGFYVPEAKLARLVDPLPSGRSPLWDVTKPAKLFSGGGGLVSTAPDYLRFAQMLLNSGELDGVRILAAKTVQQMTTNALPPEVRFAGIVGGFVGPKVGTSWGLGFAIRTNPEFSILPGAVGSFNWSGLWGTYFWIDPVEFLDRSGRKADRAADDSGPAKHGRSIRSRVAAPHLRGVACRRTGLLRRARTRGGKRRPSRYLCREIRLRTVREFEGQASALSCLRRRGIGVRRDGWPGHHSHSVR